MPNPYHTRCMMGLACLVFCITAAMAAGGDRPATAPVAPIQEIEGIQLTEAAFEGARWDQPREFKTAEAAGAFFEKDELAKLAKQVDFSKQVVLLFAWRGSGGDRLNHTVAEAFPEQIQFTLQPGRQRDLRQHVRVFVLRSDVKWRIAPAR